MRSKACVIGSGSSTFSRMEISRRLQSIIRIERIKSVGAVMLNIFKDYVLNIFIILSPLLFYPYINKLSKRTKHYRTLLCIVFSIALILTMSYPINIHGVNYDFRSIPLVIGSLYGGAVVSILLFAILLLYRYILDSPSNLLYAVAVIPSLVIFLVSMRKYNALSLIPKMGMAFLLCTLLKLITLNGYLLLSGRVDYLNDQLLVTMETYIVQGVIVVICVYIMEFIRSHVQMQEEMVNAEKMKIVSDMAASVAHEIRNPLTAVRGFIQLFGSQNLSEDKTVYYRNICLQELDRAQQIITDYLTLAKPDPEVLQKININDEIKYLSNLLHTYAIYNNIQIEGVVTEEVSPIIIGERYKFRQSVINIGKNAIEAMSENGTLMIKAERDLDNVIITISDDGIGMTPEQISRLGTPYYSTKEKGTGLGTMVSFGIIKKMNGKIEIKSIVGQGTEYTITFPEAK
jgi:two-component system sporulation sensor kinase B